MLHTKTQYFGVSRGMSRQSCCLSRGKMLSPDICWYVLYVIQTFTYWYVPVIQQRHSLKAKLTSSHPNITSPISTRRLCARNSFDSKRTVRPRMPSVPGESRESCWLNKTRPGSNKQTAVVYVGTRYKTSCSASAPRWSTIPHHDRWLAHPPHRPSPMP